MRILVAVIILFQSVLSQEVFTSDNITTITNTTEESNNTEIKTTTIGAKATDDSKTNEKTPTTISVKPPTVNSLPDDSSQLGSAILLKNWRTASELENMTIDDRRNTIIVELNKLRGTPVKELQERTNKELLDLVLGPDPTTSTVKSSPRTETPATEYPLRPTRPRITTTPKPPCVTKDGPVKDSPCKFPFIYEGREHMLCTKQEWDEFWCATDTDTEGNFIDGKWGECGESCIDDGPLRCYYKYALTDSTPQLRYCNQDENLCVLSNLKHEDGSWYQSQFCSNTTSEDWWSPASTCRYGEEGGFVCGCDYHGCNYDNHSVGYVPLKDRLLPIFFFILWCGIIILCCMCCCRCCCSNNKKNGPAHHASSKTGKWTEQEGPKKPENNCKIVMFFVCFCYFLPGIFTFIITRIV